MFDLSFPRDVMKRPIFSLVRITSVSYKKCSRRMKVKHSSKLRKTGMKTSTAYSITVKLLHALNVTTYKDK